MKFYQNNKLVATLEKTDACLGVNKKNQYRNARQHLGIKRR